MKIQWLGHSAFLIETSDGRKLVTDPYDSGSYDGAVGYEEIDVAADVVTVSHEHPDHDGVAGLIHAPGTVVRESDSTEAAGFNIRGIETFHDESHGAERGPNTIFVIEADGLRICHLGDLGHLLSDEQIEELGRVDVLLIPVGGHFTIDAAQATRIAERIKPKVVIPMHYKTKVLGFPIAGVEGFLQGKSNVVRMDSTFTEITADTLPAETEIRVLQHAR
ncbi:MAG: MBL fold metallo-hydrolase [candidate division WOR-3 bacterium]|nr:MBL fold metallo-hydrolase [candidate division WOR-3 bacterium]